MCIHERSVLTMVYQELQDLAKLYPARVRVAFSLAGVADVTLGGWTGFVGRGDASMGRSALPSPLCSDEDIGGSGENTGVMVIVCGKVQGDISGEGAEGNEDFVELWGGLMGIKLGTKGKSKVQRVQGAVGGILKEIGFSSNQVFQM